MPRHLNYGRRCRFFHLSSSFVFGNDDSSLFGKGRPSSWPASFRLLSRLMVDAWTYPKTCLNVTPCRSSKISVKRQNMSGLSTKRPDPTFMATYLIAQDKAATLSILGLRYLQPLYGWPWRPYQGTTALAAYSKLRAPYQTLILPILPCGSS